MLGAKNEPNSPEDALLSERLDHNGLPAELDGDDLLVREHKVLVLRVLQVVVQEREVVDVAHALERAELALRVLELRLRESLRALLEPALERRPQVAQERLEAEPQLADAVRDELLRLGLVAPDQRIGLQLGLRDRGAAAPEELVEPAHVLAALVPLAAVLAQHRLDRDPTDPAALVPADELHPLLRVLNAVNHWQAHPFGSPFAFRFLAR